MHLALYRAERPETFEEIIGQRHIVKILRNQLAKGSVSQAYLFAGTRGTGKTSTARILAKAVNCIGSDDPARVPCCECANCKAIREGRFLDVVELDAASNNGVDDLRAIIDSVQYPPTLGRYKVYIIDEVHMLSQAAENAFLKTLEEPPEYAIFILATTDPDKVRQTIRSRCMTLNFRRVPEDDLVAGMRRITDKRDVSIDEAALRVVARRADGSVRDALSILEQCISGGDEHVTADMIYEYTGSVGMEFYLRLTEAVLGGNAGAALADIDAVVRQGKDAKQVLADWLGHYRDLMIVKYVAAAEDIIGASPENIERLREQAGRLRTSEIERAVRLLSEQVNAARYSAVPRLLLETAAIRLSAGDEPVQARPTAPPQAPPRQAVRQRREPSGAGAAPQVQARPAASQQSQVRPAAAPPVQPETLATPISSNAAPTPSTASLAPTAVAPAQAAAAPVDYDEMWQRITAEISRTDRGFSAMVGNHSRITSFANDEIVLTVKKTKVRTANNARPEIDRVAKELFGPATFVTIRQGDIEQVRMTDFADRSAGTTAEDIADDLGSLLGMDVTVK